ncbi:unnamed protein product [Arabidopsis halleri]
MLVLEDIVLQKFEFFFLRTNHWRTYLLRYSLCILSFQKAKF